MAGKVSLKRVQINKANTTMVASIAVAAFIAMFSIVASRALWNKRGFQGRLINEKEAAVAQLEENLQTVDELVVSYQAFVDTPENVIGGNPNGSGERDGDNAKITLDSLPSQYDFPALATSLEKILADNYDQIGISGEDEEVSRNAEGVEQAIQPTEIPFETTATGNLDAVKDLLKIYENSIRPISVQTLELTGSNADLTIAVTAKTYYQPEKNFTVQTKVVK